MGWSPPPCSVFEHKRPIERILTNRCRGNYMRRHLAISLSAILAAASCTHRAPTPANPERSATPIILTIASENELHQHVGEGVTMLGKFSLRGKIGPFVLVNDRPIYLVPQGSFSWGEPFASMEGKDVRITGILRFAHYPDPSPGALPEGRPSDHFYFDAETAKVELSQE
jgi:hypothetical protein